MIITTYSDRGNSYAAQKGIILKMETNTSMPGNSTSMYVNAPGQEDLWIPCKVDDNGNICYDDNIIIYPSGSGSHPLQAGDYGNFGVRRVTALRTARTGLGLTQAQLADSTDINLKKIQQIEAGRKKVGSLTAQEQQALGKAVMWNPRDLI